jgi:hypothetical protein
MACEMTRGAITGAMNMKLHPFYETAKEAENIMQSGATVFQQYTCASCGTKQTMETPNVFHKFGRCEECQAITDIEQDGCNYMCVFGIKAEK